MRQKRVRSKLFQFWLHPKELDFLHRYAEENMLTASDVIRGWIHEIMKREGYKIKEPQLPETKIKKQRK